MKIQIPNQIPLEDLGEGDAMLIALLHLICNRHGYNHWYNMNGGDWRKIGFPKGCTNPAPFGPRTAVMRKHIQLCQLGESNILLRFKNVRPKAKGPYDRVGNHQYELKDIRSIQIWCYLMGLWHGKNPIISEANAIIPYEDNRRTMEYLEHKNFLVG